MRLLLITDAWHPQVNGVVRTLERTIDILARDHNVTTTVISPDQFKSVALPAEPGLRLSLAGRRALAKRIDGLEFDHIHVATEGPLGWATRAYARTRGLRFTTAFHTQFAEYMAARYRVPTTLSYRLLRRFHSSAAQTLVTTPSMQLRLADKGFNNLTLWSRGVDTSQFSPDGALPPSELWKDWQRPFWLNVGRVAPEKNLDAFLSLDLPGTMVLIGDGPARPTLEQRHPGAKFLGVKTGADLAAWYRLADCFVFPSRTDTFGLVNVEALACGTPVAAYPVEGPRDIIENRVSGILGSDLRAAALSAVELSPADCCAAAAGFSWEAATQQFVEVMRDYPARPRAN